MKSAWGDERTRFFFELTPERVLTAVEEAGYRCTGRWQALGSYENRVYDVEIEVEEESDSLSTSSRSPSRWRIVKFYRPGRWSSEQILEEHRFLLDLAEAEIPAVAPLFFPDGGTLRSESATGISYALFPKVGGRAPDELDDEKLARVGRLLARIHNVGATQEAPNRIRISPETYGLANLEFLLKGDWIPFEYRGPYQQVVETLCARMAPWFTGREARSVPYFRIHGDCHLGNLLWSPQGPFFVDFDDMLQGPAVQDIWLLTPGRDQVTTQQRETLLEGYEQLRAFDRSTLKLVEPLRALRFIHFAAWIARRWEDPAFPQAFPHFGTPRYWDEQVRDLQEQLALISSEASY